MAQHNASSMACIQTTGIHLSGPDVLPSSTPVSRERTILTRNRYRSRNKYNIFLLLLLPLLLLVFRHGLCLPCLRRSCYHCGNYGRFGVQSNNPRPALGQRPLPPLGTICRPTLLLRRFPYSVTIIFHNFCPNLIAPLPYNRHFDYLRPSIS